MMINLENMKVSQSDSLRQENITKALTTNVIKDTKVRSGLGLKTVNIGDATLVSPSLPNYSLNKENSLSVLNQLRDFGLQKTSFIDKACSVVFNAANKLNTYDADDNDDFFDISHISPQGVALLTDAIILFNVLFRSEVNLSSKLSVISFEHAQTAADKIKAEGKNALWGGVAQGTVGLAMASVGAVEQSAGISKERNVYAEAKKGASTPKTPTETPVAPASTTPSDSTLNMEMEPRNDALIEASDSQPRTNATEEQDTKINKSLTQDKKIDELTQDKKIDELTQDKKIDELLTPEQQHSLKIAQILQIGGQWFSQAGSSIGSIIMQSSQYYAKIDQASSQIEQAQSQATNVAADNLRNVSSSVLNLIQEMLKILDSLCQSKLSNMTVFSSHI